MILSEVLIEATFHSLSQCAIFFQI